MRSETKEIIKTWLIPPGWWRLLSLIRRNDPALRKLFSPEIQRLLQQNKQLLNKHKGERCFILGAGSSVKQQDLKKLAGECVLSLNNTFVHPDYSVFKPKYHIMVAKEGGPNQNFKKFYKEAEKKTLDAEWFLYIGDKKFMDDNELFKNRSVHWYGFSAWNEIDCDFPLDLSRVPGIQSGSELAITIALYLGFDKIYLIGFDHDWFNGLFVYFFDNSQHILLEGNSPTSPLFPQIDSEYQMRRHAYIFKKYKCLYQKKKNIYNANANPNSYVDVFPKVDFDSLFE